jgi:hypothetical protein
MAKRIRKTPRAVAQAIAEERNSGLPPVVPFADIQDALKEYGTGWNVRSDPNLPDRMVVTSPQGQILPLTTYATQSENKGGNKIYALESGGRRGTKIINEQLDVNYDEAKGNVNFSGKTSAQYFAKILAATAEEAQGTRSSWGSVFQNTIMQGRQERGISALSSLPYGSKPGDAAARINLNSVGMNINAKPNNQSFTMKVLSNALNAGNRPDLPQTTIAGKGDLGQPGLNFADMAKRQLIPWEGGRLIPIGSRQTLPSHIQETGKWTMESETKRYGKAPNFYPVESVQPYRLGRNGVPVELEPQTVYNQNAQGWVHSNALLSGESQARPMEIVNRLYDKNVSSGSIIAYENPTGLDVDLYGRKSVKTAPIGNTTIDDIMKDRVKIQMGDLAGRKMGGGKEVVRVGSFQRGDNDPEPIKARVGANKFIGTGENKFFVPKYVNKQTWEGVEDVSNEVLEKIKMGEETDVVMSDPYLKDIEKKVGMPVEARAGTKMGVEVGGVLTAGVAAKIGMGEKAFFEGAGAEQFVNVGGQQVRVDELAGPVKGPAELPWWFGSKTYQQTRGLLKEFAGMDEAGQSVLRSFQSRYKKREGMTLDTDWDQLADVYNKHAGEGRTVPTGMALQSRIFGSVIESAEPGSERDIANWEKYGATHVPGQQVSRGVFTKDEQQWLKETWAEGGQTQGKTQEEIDKLYNETFSLGTEGLSRESLVEGNREVFQKTSRDAMLLRQGEVKRMEYSHGTNVNAEFLTGLGMLSPEFATALNANLDTNVPQGPAQQAAVGLQKYLTWQNQRLKQFHKGEEMPVNENVREVGPEELQRISATIEALRGNTQSNLGIVETLNKSIFKDTPADQLLHITGSNVYYPNPKTIEKSTFKELGIEAGAVSGPYLQGFNKLAMNEDLGGTPAMLHQAGIEATNPFFGYVAKMAGSGNFFKRILNRSLPQAVGGKFHHAGYLNAGEISVSKGQVRNLVSRLGFKGEEAAEARKFLQQNSIQVAEGRFPQPTREAVYSYKTAPDDTIVKRIGEERWKNIRNNPKLQYSQGVGSWHTGMEQSDFDADTMLAIMGVRKNEETGKLEKIEDTTMAAKQLTIEKAKEQEQAFFPRESARLSFSSGAGELADFFNPKKRAWKALDNVQSVNPSSLYEAGITRAMSKGSGMGEGYNLRWPIISMMEGRYSQQETSNVLNTVASQYQGALDMGLQGGMRGGTPAASLLAKSYMSMPDWAKGGSVLHLGGSDTENVKRSKREIKPGMVLSPEAESKSNLRLDEMFSSTRQMTTGTAHIVNQFSKAVPLAKGGDASMTREQVASWMALPGESEQLAEQMTGDKDNWGTNVMAYYQKTIARYQDEYGKKEGMQKGLEQIYMTPAWGSAIANAGMKAEGRTNIATDEGQVEGALPAWQQFLSQVSPETRQVFETAVTTNAIGRKNKNLNPNPLSAFDVSVAAASYQDRAAVGGTTPMGDLVQSYARMMDVPLWKQKPWAERHTYEAMDNTPEAQQVTKPVTTPAFQSHKTKMLSELSEAEQAKQERTASEVANDREYNVSKYYRDAKQAGTFTGTFDEYMELQKTPAPESVQAEAESTSQNFDFNAVPEIPFESAGGQPPVPPVPPVAEATPAPKQPKKSVRTANQPRKPSGRRAKEVYREALPVYPAFDTEEQRGAWETFRTMFPGTPSVEEAQKVQAKRLTAAEERATEGQMPLTNVTRTEMEISTKFPLRLGMFTRQTAMQAAEYENQKPLMPEIDQVLTDMGYAKNPNEVDTADVRGRLKKAYIEKKDEFYARLSPEQQKRLTGLKGMQQNVWKASALVNDVPGIAGDQSWIRDTLFNAMGTSSNLGRDISVLGPLGYEGSHALPTQLRGAIDLVNNPGTQVLMKKMQESGVLGSHKFGRKETAAVKDILASGGPSLDDLAQQTFGSNFEGLSDARKAEVQAAKDESYGYREVMRLAGKTSTKAAHEIGLGELRGISKEYAVREGADAFKPTSGVKLTADAIESVTKAYDAQVKAATELAKVQGNAASSSKALSEAQETSHKANLKYRAALSGLQAEQAQGQVSEYISGLQPGDTLDVKKLRGLQGEVERSQKERVAAESELAPETKGERWGSAARRMLGGFGLMYLRSIGNFATQGLGYGMEERQAFDTAGAAGAYQYTGQAQVPYNQQATLATNRALYGVNNTPMVTMQQAMAKQPLARDAWNSVSAGLGVWGYTQFAAGQIAGPTGAALGTAALPLAVAAGGGAMLADAYSKKSDPALAYRQATGRFGINDYMALGLMNQKELGEYRPQEGFYEQFHKAASLGAPTSALMNFDYEYQPTKQKDLFTTIGGQITGKGTTQKPNISQADRFFALQREVAERYENYSPEAQSGATGFLLRSGGSVTDKNLGNVISDIQLGGWAQQTALQGAQAVGYKASQIFGKEGASLQQYFADQAASGNYDEATKAQITTGFQRTTQLAGFERIAGLGGRGGVEIDNTKLEKAVKSISDLSDSSFGVLQGRMQLVQTQQQAGIRSANMTQMELDRYTYQVSKMTPEQQEQANQATQAQMSTLQNRMGMQQQWQSRMAQVGEFGVGQQASKFIGAQQVGQEWKANRLLSADPMMLSMMAAERPDLFAQLKGPETIQGMQINPNFMATADRDLSGKNLTGLSQFRTSLWMGNQNPAQMGAQIFGQNQNTAAAQAAIGGANLPVPVTLPTGQVVSKVGGTMGLQIYGQQLDYQYQQAQIGLQRKGMESDYGYQMQMWGLQDQQRNLGYQHQMAQFGFQEQGMQLSQQSAEMGNRFWWQNANMQQQQTQTQRAWTRQDWGINAQTREMQWGWQQEDFQEEKRFMTGRQRRLAERQQDRAGITHNLEDEQINRQQKRQQELWKMEDERFEVSKQQHGEQWQLQLKQMELQRKEFEENKKFYLEGKKLEDQIIALQRAHWLEQHKLSKEQLDLTKEHAKATLDLQMRTAELNTYMELVNGTMRTLTDETMTKFIESIGTLTDALSEWMGSDSNPLSSATSGSNNPYITASYTGGGTSNSGGGSYTPPQIAAAQYANNASSPGGTTSTNTNAQYYGNFYGHAGGGSLADSLFNVQKVGEQGYEYVIGNEVIPHNQSVAMERAGIVAGDPVDKASRFTDGGVDMSGLFPQVFPSQSPFQKQSKPVTIVVQVGNEELKRYVVDVVGDQF